LSARQIGQMANPIREPPAHQRRPVALQTGSGTRDHPSKRDGLRSHGTRGWGGRNRSPSLVGLAQELFSFQWNRVCAISDTRTGVFLRAAPAGSIDHFFGRFSLRSAATTEIRRQLATVFATMCVGRDRLAWLGTQARPWRRTGGRSTGSRRPCTLRWAPVSLPPARRPSGARSRARTSTRRSRKDNPGRGRETSHRDDALASIVTMLG
jgi:hypothetical protein